MHCDALICSRSSHTGCLVYVSHLLFLSLLLDALHWLSRRPVQAGERLPLILHNSKCRASAVGAIGMPRLRGRPWQTRRQD